MPLFFIFAARPLLTIRISIVLGILQVVCTGKHGMRRWTVSPRMTSLLLHRGAALGGYAAISGQSQIIHQKEPANCWL